MSEEQWIRVGAAGSLDVGSMTGVKQGDLHIAVYNVGGEFFATDNICSHAFALLTDGQLDGDIIECPLHGGCFRVKTGEGMGEPVSRDIRTYPVRIMNGIIEILVS